MRTAKTFTVQRPNSSETYDAALYSWKVTPGGALSIRRLEEDCFHEEWRILAVYAPHAWTKVTQDY